MSIDIEDQFRRLGWRVGYCPAPGCYRKLGSPRSTACLTHWSALPYGLRKFEGRDLGQAYMECLKKCLRFWSENA